MLVTIMYLLNKNTGDYADVFCQPPVDYCEHLNPTLLSQPNRAGGLISFLAVFSCLIVGLIPKARKQFSFRHYSLFVLLPSLVTRYYMFIFFD